jgi:hypothetical protein
MKDCGVDCGPGYDYCHNLSENCMVAQGLKMSNKQDQKTTLGFINTLKSIHMPKGWGYTTQTSSIIFNHDGSISPTIHDGLKNEGFIFWALNLLRDRLEEIKISDDVIQSKELKELEFIKICLNKPIQQINLTFIFDVFTQWLQIKSDAEREESWSQMYFQEVNNSTKLRENIKYLTILGDNLHKCLGNLMGCKDIEIIDPSYIASCKAAEEAYNAWELKNI